MAGATGLVAAGAARGPRPGRGRRGAAALQGTGLPRSLRETGRTVAVAGWERVAAAPDGALWLGQQLDGGSVLGCVAPVWPAWPAILGGWWWEGRSDDPAAARLPVAGVAALELTVDAAVEVLGADGALRPGSGSGWAFECVVRPRARKRVPRAQRPAPLLLALPWVEGRARAAAMAKPSAPAPADARALLVLLPPTFAWVR